MPEGDTVWLSAKQMHDAFAGRSLTRSDFRVPRYATHDFAGRVVHEVVARGKHMLTRLDGGWTVHTHFGMDGAWRIYRGARTSRARSVRLVLANDEWTALGTSLAAIDVVRTRDERALVGHLGPDVLADDFDAAEAVRRLAAHPERAIGDALLDQRLLAGVGNLYRAEVLFLAAVSPWRAIAETPDLDALVQIARDLMVANRERWAQITTGDTRRGHEHWVFERTGRSCRRCGTAIRSAEQPTSGGPRLAYWCPTCQR